MGDAEHRQDVNARSRDNERDAQAMLDGESSGCRSSGPTRATLLDAPFPVGQLERALKHTVDPARDGLPQNNRWMGCEEGPQ